MNINLFIYTWNTQSVSYNNDGLVPNFIEQLHNTILTNEYKYDLVIFGLQEDSIKDSILSKNIENSLIYGLLDSYKVVDTVELSGWGSTTYKSLRYNFEYKPRGLRLIVLVNKDTKLHISNIESHSIVCPGWRNWLTSGKGGVAINLTTNFGVISFLNMHLPFDSNSLNNNKRHQALIWQSHCLTYLYDNVINKYNPSIIFLMGDLNFRVQIQTENGASSIARKLFTHDITYIQQLIREADELNLLMGYYDTNSDLCNLITTMSEGVHNSGTVFLPTCKMNHGRGDIYIEQEKSYLLGYNDERAPSWCDRILYKSNDPSKLFCSHYNRWSAGNMNLSDHDAVIGIFHIKNIQT